MERQAAESSVGDNHTKVELVRTMKGVVYSVLRSAGEGMAASEDMMATKGRGMTR